jgi:hypothetical protein
MNFFCRLFGHTWVHRSDNPKIRWTTAKNLSELDMEVAGEVRFWEECVRCKERREVAKEDRRRAS